MVLTFRYVLLCCAPVAFAAEEPLVTSDAIVTRMTVARARNHETFRAYQVTREYVLVGNDGHTPKSRVVAAVTFSPPSTKHYTIVSRTTILGERVVRQMLDGEVATVDDDDATDLSPANYEFRLARTETWNGRHCYVLDMTPRRKEKGLLRGSIWVDNGTFLVQRLVGEPVKSPSWWVRRASIEFSFGPVNGMWLPTGFVASAIVRMFGPYTMTSRDTDYAMGNVNALVTKP